MWLLLIYPVTKVTCLIQHVYVVGLLNTGMWTNEWTHHGSFSATSGGTSLQSEYVSAPRVQSIHHKEPLRGAGV